MFMWHGDGCDLVIKNSSINQNMAPAFGQFSLYACLFFAFIQFFITQKKTATT